MKQSKLNAKTSDFTLILIFQLCLKIKKFLFKSSMYQVLILPNKNKVKL